MPKIVNSDELTVNNYTKLGSGGPSIKTKKITFTTASTEGGVRYVSHGVDRSKILPSSSVLVTPSFPANTDIPPSYTIDADLEYQVKFTTDDVVITNKAGNSGFILSQPGRIFLVYEE